MCCLTEVANYPNRFIISCAQTKENYNQTIAIVRAILSNLVNNNIKYTEIKSFNFKAQFYIYAKLYKLE